MAANIDISTGRPAIAYNARNGTPWHSMGTPIDGRFDAQTGLDDGGLNFPVYKIPAYYDPADIGIDQATAISTLNLINATRIPGKYVTVRGDTREPLGVVGEDYKVFQNKECFDFLDTVTGKGISYDVVGALDGGRKVWLTGKLDGSIYVRDDQIDKYLLLSTSHDGSSAVRVLWTPIRVVCQNTLAAALKGGRATGITVRHSGNLSEKLETAREVLELAAVYFDDLAGALELTATAKPNAEQVEAYFKTLYPSDATRSKNIRADLTNLFENGTGQNDSTRRTVYSAYQAYTEYMTYQRGTQNAETEVEAQTARMENLWFGSGVKSNATALENAVSLAQTILN